MTFLSRAGSAPTGPFHCQSQHSSSEAARKGVGERFSELLLQLQLQVQRRSHRAAQARPVHKDEELEAGRLRHLRPCLQEEMERVVTTGIGQLQTIPGPEWAPRECG